MQLIDRMFTDRFLKNLHHLRYGKLQVTLPTGQQYSFAGPLPGPAATLVLHDLSVISNLVQKGDVGFAQDYQAGRWECDDLTNLMTLGMLNEAALADYIFGSRLMQMLGNLSYFLRRNSLQGSRRNIQAHYDLGNDFYRLWLDPSMTYSAALFTAPQQSLEQAQDCKYDRIIDRLEGSSGSLIEVGCGWGGFADRALQRGDFNIKGITLSDQQHEYARTKLGPRANIALEDYRHQEGRFDHIVSIEMFEAVGERYWPTYFSKMASLLKPGGKAVVQTITIAEERFTTYRNSTDVIRSFIFPGGMLPSPERFREAASQQGLRVNDVFHFGQDYATTLEHWLQRFNARENEVRALGFDNRFIRLWRFYLASCIAGFRTNRTSVMQVEMQHA